MKSGQLTVTGNGDTRLLLDGPPRYVNVHFVNEPGLEPVPCNPHHIHDHVEYQIDYEDEDRRHVHDPGYHRHDRKFVLIIRWQVSGVRDIHWSVS
jgi:hypothetical protein